VFVSLLLYFIRADSVICHWLLRSVDSYINKEPNCYHYYCCFQGDLLSK
jgi:hypothetical protein